MFSEISHRLLRNVSKTLLLLIPDSTFKKIHSSIHQLYRVTKLIKNYFQKHKSPGMITANIEEAYDTTWDNVLINKIN